MQNLSYVKPENLHQALELMDKNAGRIKPYAGGTDLMVQLREEARRLEGVEILLDLGGLAELRGIREEGGVIGIGAMSSHTEVSESAVLREHAAFLSKASATVGSPQIRNAGTVGGNICNGSPAADTLSPFVALDARLVIQRLGGERQALVKDIYLGANKVSLEPNEIVTRIEFDKLDGYATSFIKLGRRKALAISRMNVAVALKIEDGVLQAVRLTPGCVYAAPKRVECAEAFLLGKEPSVERFGQAGKLVAEDMIQCTGVRWSTEYKQPVVEALCQRALCEAAGIPQDEWA